MHILLLTKNHCFYLVVPTSGPFSTHFVLYAWGLAARSSSWPQLATTPTATFRWRLFILSFYRYENSSSERLSNLSEVTQQWGGGGPDIWVHALYCTKSKFIFLMGKGEDDSWLISAEDLIISLPDLAQVRSESRLQQPGGAKEAKGQRRGTALSLEPWWPACPLCHLELFPEGQQSLWYHQVLFSRRRG